VVGCKPISDDEMNCPDMNLPKTKVLTELLPSSEGREQKKNEKIFTEGNEANEELSARQRFCDENLENPSLHSEFLKRCHDCGQLRPTPWLLQYVPGDYNCLHQDLYGDLAFPIQVAILLSEPGEDFTGGEFVLAEQRPRITRAEVVPLGQGDAVAFAVHHRPMQGTRGTYRVNLRHGVSRVRSGRRYTVGIIFHDGA
jgi:uncharacterized protein